MTYEKKKICLIGPTYPYRGGIAHHTTLLSRTLVKKHDLLFISFSRQYPRCIYPGKTDKDNSDSALKPLDVSYLLDSINPWTWITTARHIAEYNPVILVIPWWVVFWAPPFATVATLVRRWCGAQVVLFCHNVVEHEASWFKRFLSRAMLSIADRIVTQSSLETTRVQKLISSSAPVVTGFQPTFESLTSNPVDPQQTRKDLGLSGKILLFFGFVRPYKGLDTLLEAMSEVATVHNVTLLVVGEFWKDKDRYLDQILRLDIGEHVKIIDDYVPNEEIGKYFAVADLVVQPYHSATGSAICQLAYGLETPVIATRVGNLAEVINDGINGKLVPPGDTKALANALNCSLEQNTLATMKKNAAMTKELFSWDKFADLLIN